MNVLVFKKKKPPFFNNDLRDYIFFGKGLIGFKNGLKVKAMTKENIDTLMYLLEVNKMFDKFMKSVDTLYLQSIDEIDFESFQPFVNQLNIKKCFIHDNDTLSFSNLDFRRLFSLIPQVSHLSISVYTNNYYSSLTLIEKETFCEDEWYESVWEPDYTKEQSYFDSILRNVGILKKLKSLNCDLALSNWHFSYLRNLFIDSPSLQNLYINNKGTDSDYSVEEHIQPIVRRKQLCLHRTEWACLIILVCKRFRNSPVLQTWGKDITILVSKHLLQTWYDISSWAPKK